MGYAGGSLADPTYHHLGNHREAVEVTFDPRLISYQQLLDVFWGSFPVTLPPGPSRTRTAVLPRSEEQLAAAERSKRRLRRRVRERIPTEILPDASFWPAERLHQKFHLQRVHPDLVRKLAGGYVDLDAFLASTAATRLNAHVSGFAGSEALEEVAEVVDMEAEALRRRLHAD